MVGLIYKEWILQRRNLIILGIVYFILTAGLFLPAGMDYLQVLSTSFEIEERVLIVIWELAIFVLGFVLMAVFQSTIFEVDENKKWAGFIATTPLTGEGQVGAKYYFVLLLSVLTLVWAWIVETIAIVVFQLETSLLEVAVLMFYGMLFLHAFEFPFIIRFGSRGGRIFQEILIPLVMYGVIIYFLFGDISALGSPNDMLNNLAQMLLNGENVERIMPLQAIFPYASVACYALSYWVAKKFYLKGVDTYVK